jgi:hypothetical protein
LRKLGLLPTEDPVAFKEFCRDILSEYAPVGRSEEFIVAEMARLMWRRQNLSTYHLAKQAGYRRSSIYSKLAPPNEYDLSYLLGAKPETRSPEELRMLRKEADEQASTELGAALDLVQIGEVATTDYLERELSLAERLDAMIDKYIKRLLLVRGVKSISPSVPAASSRPRLKTVA